MTVEKRGVDDCAVGGRSVCLRFAANVEIQSLRLGTPAEFHFCGSPPSTHVIQNLGTYVGTGNELLEGDTCVRGIASGGQTVRSGA